MPTRQRGGSGSREATRERLFEAFVELLHERGYDVLTLADVAERAGVSRTSVYNYVADKDALVVAYADQEASRQVAELARRLEGLANPVDRLRAFIDARLRYLALGHLPPTASLRMALSPAAYQRVGQHATVLDGVLREILTAAAAEGYLDAADVERCLPLVTACLGRSDADGRDPAALDDAIEDTTTFVLRALGIRLGADGRPRRRPRARG